MSIKLRSLTILKLKSLIFYEHYLRKPLLKYAKEILQTKDIIIEMCLNLRAI